MARPGGRVGGFHQAEVGCLAQDSKPSGRPASDHGVDEVIPGALSVARSVGCSGTRMILMLDSE